MNEIDILKNNIEKFKPFNEQEEVECRNLERKQMPYRDIAKKYEESKA